MQNLIWTITIRRSDRSSITKYVPANEKKTIDIGSDHSQDIWIQEAFPQHITLCVDSQSMQLQLQAHKKIISEYQDQSRIITKNEAHSISLSATKTFIKIKIKNSIIECTIEHDNETIDRYPDWKQTIESQYGKMSKIAEGHFTWIYHCGRYVVKILKPAYVSQAEYVASFMQAANNLRQLSLEQTLDIENIIFDEQVGLYAWITNYVEGTTLHDLIAQKKKIDSDTIASIIESLTDFIHDLHLQGKLYAAINPHDIYLDTERNIFILGHFYSRLVATNLCQNLPKVHGFVHHSQIRNNVSQEADSFLLGSLLYFLTTTKVPFSTIPKKEYASLLQQNKLPQLNDIPAKYSALIRQALESSQQDVQNFWHQFQKIEFNKKAYDATEEMKVSMDERDDYFGNFILKKKLGRGYLGTIYKALRNNKPLIIKILNGTDKYTRAIIQDATDASVLEHRNILRIIEINKCGDTHYIAYENISGQNLEQYATENKLSIQKCLMLIRDLARALQYAHVKGIVHRNIKPSNIIINEEGQPFLVDFGLSTDLYMNRMFDKQLQKDFTYQSPSVLFGSLSPLHDVYSLGAVMYKLLTNSFESNKLYLPLWRRPNITREAESICSKALAKQAKKRYQNASIFADDIDKLLQHKPIIAPSFNWLTDIQRRYRFANYIVYIFVIFLFLVAAKIIYTPQGIYVTTSIETVENLQQKYETDYLDNLQKLASPSDISTPENFYIQKKVYQENIHKLQLQYKTILQTKLLPICQKLYLQEPSKQHHDKLLEVLKNIIIFSPETEQEIYISEYQKLAPSQQKTIKVNINNPRNSYLFKVEKNLLGQNEIRAFDIEKQTVTKNNAQQKFSPQSMNLFVKALQRVLKKQHFEAQEILIAVIKKSPLYIDAYQLLCVSLYMSSLQKQKSAAFQTWQKKALQTINDSNIKNKKQLKTKFIHDHIQTMAHFYQNIINGNHILLRVTSVIDRTKRLQKNDLIYKINNKYINSNRLLYNAVHYKKTVSCQIIRNYESISAEIPTSIFRSSRFYTKKDIPFNSLTKLGFLSPPPKSSENPTNEITTSPIELPVGNYVIYQNNYFRSFHVKQNVDTLSHSLGKMDKEINLPQELQKNYVSILYAFPKSKLNNQHGYIIGRNEVTIKEWKQFLYATYRMQGKKAVKNVIPILSTGKPLFYMYKGEFTQIIGQNNWPIFAVSVEQIKKFLDWKNENTNTSWKEKGFVWRLPSKKEWEYTARGDMNNKYVASNYNNAVFYNTSFSIQSMQRIYPVGAYSSDRSIFLAEDLGGNVKEYILDKNNKFGLKGNSWKDGILAPIDFTLYSVETATAESCGFRLCAGIDPFVKK
ncbi:protein kinase domain-containing protein [Candidatus Uabimicrobium amorphum]|uniref:Protein kinase n=1 Tax=Uabimicrobium amorphum TaxID=2596890 RepID=A0A5S9INM4_UABAM|nr:protein kinase [Candidatus Uabimicrobium amorphum]BBM84746.1 protein kinase [Candidatus Uabimicrobium amorphum]